MSAISFPLLTVPMTRELVVGSHPVKVFKALNGAEYPVLQGDRMTDARIDAGWPSLADEEAWMANYAWEQSYSGVLNVQLPPGLLQGIELDGQVFPGYLHWTIAEMPKIKSTYPGRSSLALTMRGRLLGVTVDDATSDLMAIGLVAGLAQTLGRR